MSPFLIRSALVLTAPRLTENDRGGEEISTLEALEAIKLKRCGIKRVLVMEMPQESENQFGLRCL